MALQHVVPLLEAWQIFRAEFCSGWEVFMAEGDNRQKHDAPGEYGTDNEYDHAPTQREIVPLEPALILASRIQPS